MRQAPNQIISQERLKLLACMTMLLDHIGAIFFPACLWMRIIGRISFPLYAFLLAEGIHYSRSPAKYGLRLLLVAVMAELPYDLLFFGQFTWAKNSVMVTLLLGFLMGMAMKGQSLWVQLLLVIPFVYISDFIRGDYGRNGVLMIAIFLVTRKYPRLLRLLMQSMLLTALSLHMAGYPARMGIPIYAIAAMVPIALYSGKKRSHSKALQWGFTLFYPAHLILILLIRGN